MAAREAYEGAEAAAKAKREAVKQADLVRPRPKNDISE